MRPRSRRQLGVFVDGNGPSALVRYDGRAEPLAYLDYLTSALPYHLLTRPRVLVLGAGAGADVLQAIALGARAVDAVEMNPHMIDLVQRRFGNYSGQPYSLPAVRAHVGEARAFVARHDARFDLIQVALFDGFAASSAGLHALSESYLYTVEGLAAYLDRLEPGGLVVTLDQPPPPACAKLFATAATALESARHPAGPGRRLILIRLETATLVVKNGAFTAGRDRGTGGAFAGSARSTPTISPASNVDRPTATTCSTAPTFTTAPWPCSGRGGVHRSLQVRHCPGHGRPATLPTSFAGARYRNCWR
jgi:hypothetical protein